MEKGEREVGSVINAWGLLGRGLRGIYRNRRVSSALSPISYLFLEPEGVLYLRVQRVFARDEALDASTTPIVSKRRPGSTTPTYGIPAELWPTVVQHVAEQKEPLRTVAASFGVSHETIRRIMLLVQRQCGQQKA